MYPQPNYQNLIFFDKEPMQKNTDIKVTFV